MLFYKLSIHIDRSSLLLRATQPTLQLCWSSFGSHSRFSAYKTFEKFLKILSSTVSSFLPLYVFVSSFSSFLQDGFEFSQQDIRNMAQLHYHSEHFYFLLKQGSSGAVALFDEVARPEALAVAGHGRESCVTSSGLTINQLDLGLAVHAAGGDYKESLLLACTRLFIDSLLESFGTDEIPATVADELVDALAATSNVADHECFPLFKGNISDRIPFSPSERQQMLLTRLAAGEAHLAAFKEVLHKAEDLLALVDLWDLERMFRNPPIMNGDELKNVRKF